MGNRSSAPSSEGEEESSSGMYLTPELQGERHNVYSIYEYIM